MKICCCRTATGPFFQTLNQVLSGRRPRVYKIHFNGDECWRCVAIANASPQSRDTCVSTFFRRFIKRHGIDSLICYG